MAQPIRFSSRSTADQVLAGIDLSRKHMLVTECNSPIGLETMKALSANGAVVIGVARALSDAVAACAVVGRSIPLGCDPTDQASVEAVIESLRHLSDPLDAVIINSFESPSVDRTAQFAFVERLAEFARDATGRVVIAGDDPNLMEPPVESVGETQVAGALSAKELARRLKARGVMVNTFHSPARGNRDTRGARPVQRLIRSLLGFLARSPAQRAATAALLAASPLVAGLTGEYWSDCQISRNSRGAAATAERGQQLAGRSPDMQARA